MDYWADAVSEAMEAEGVKATNVQIDTIAKWMKSAHECHQSGPPSEPSRTAPERVVPERRAQWWEDTSQLVGSEWTLANQIHRMISSRFG